MNTIEIKCHSCGTTLELTKALAAPLLDTQRREFEDKIAQRERAQLKREKEFSQREEKLSQQEEEIDSRVKQQLKSKLAQEKKEFDRKYSLEIDSLNQRLEEKYNEISQAQKNELEMRKARDEALREKERAELEIKRQVDDQLNGVREKAISQANDSANRKIHEQDQILQGLRKQISDMERKADPTAAHLHGEIEEDAIVTRLRQEYPQDTFERVKKGARGADIRQQVKLANGRTAGTILIEVKNTQNWDNNWIPKVKDDQRVAGVDVPVIVSRALPQNITSFADIDNVWVCAVPLIVPMIGCLRNGLLGVAREKSASAVSADRKEQIFQYLKSNSFSMRISGIVEAYDAMRNELDKEKKTQHNYWAKREVSLNRMLQGISGLSGDFQQLGGPGVLEDQSTDSLAHTTAPAIDNTIAHEPINDTLTHTPNATDTAPGVTASLPEVGGTKAGWASSEQEVFIAPPVTNTMPQESPGIQFKPIPSAQVDSTIKDERTDLKDPEKQELNILEVLISTGQTLSVGSPLVSILDNKGQVRLILSNTQGTVRTIAMSAGQHLSEEAITRAFTFD